MRADDPVVGGVNEDLDGRRRHRSGSSSTSRCCRCGGRPHRCRLLPPPPRGQRGAPRAYRAPRDRCCAFPAASAATEQRAYNRANSGWRTVVSPHRCGSGLAGRSVPQWHADCQACDIVTIRVVDQLGTTRRTPHVSEQEGPCRRRPRRGCDPFHRPGLAGGLMLLCGLAMARLMWISESPPPLRKRQDAADDASEASGGY